MLNSYITLTETQRILQQPRINALTGALRSSIDTWNSALASAQMVLDKSARAMIINQYWYSFVNLALGGDEGVVLRNDQLQRFLVIDERIILRFKLIDNNFHSRNYPTKRAIQWSLQKPFAGIPQCERLELGYRLDITGTIVRDAFVLLKVGDRIVWMWQIGGERIDTFPIQLELRPSGTQEPQVFAYNNYLS